MAGSAFTKGLHDFGNGCFGYLQPDGGWGLSNAGLVVGVAFNAQLSSWNCF